MHNVVCYTCHILLLLLTHVGTATASFMDLVTVAMENSNTDQPASMSVFSFMILTSFRQALFIVSLDREIDHASKNLEFSGSKRLHVSYVR